MKKIFLALSLFVVSTVQAAVDPNFYVYLCFGQSNMEGQAEPEAVDKENVDPRFQTMACVTFTQGNIKRTMGQWDTAYPPIVRQWTKIGMADYFGRTMVAALPADVKVGVVDVAIGGVSIDGFMSEKVAEYLKNQEDWMKSSFAAYDNDPYKRLVEMAKIAQQSGVIKGILLHQGESDNGQQVWLEKVKTVYERLLTDLGLQAADVPLFAGETVNSDVGGICGSHNAIIAQLPTVIPTAHVVPSNGCPCASDNIHFTVSGYRTMGKRYAYEVLRTMGQPTVAQESYSWNDNLKKIYTLSKLEPVDDIKLRVGGSKVLTVWGTFADGHQENLTNEVTFSSSDFTIEGNKVIANAEKNGTVTASYTDFLGHQHSLTINVNATASGPNQYLVVENGAAGTNAWDREAFCKLATPMVKGKKYVIHATIRAEQGNACVLWPRWDASTNRDQWGNSADIQYLDNKTVGTTFQELTWNCTANFPHDVLIFAIGTLGGKVCFDDVSCVEEGTTAEMIANGSFDSDDISDWSVLSYTGQTLYVQQEATAIQQLTTDRPAAEAVYYDLQGRRIAHPSKGLYIIKGKKVLVP